MVCGFLGTVIALERAVGLRGWWTYAGWARAGIANLGRQVVFLGRNSLGSQIAAREFYDHDVRRVRSHREWATGVLMMAFSPLESGLHYDAVLHSFFLSFVFSMIFGHAPVIFPAALGLQPSFRIAFYIHVMLLHLALLLRVSADVTNWGVDRQWRGIMSAMAMGCS